MDGSGATRYIILTDIARSSYLWETFPEEYPALLETHNRITESAVEQFGGEVMKNLGDGYIALFGTPTAALGSAVELQLAFAATGIAFSDGTPLRLRVVLHGGPLQQLEAGRGWFGTALNRAARIAGVAHPGQTLLSGYVRQRLPEYPAELELLDLGRVRLRDLGEPEQLCQVCHPAFAQQDFPALLGMDSRPNNLREQPGSFIGREEELRRLLLEDKQRLVTLTAPGGYGKSRVANQLCASLLHRYEHGAWIVELAPLADSASIAERTAEALSFKLQSAEEPRKQLVGYLRGKQALIHFDNFEHVAAGASLLTDILQDCPGVQCVVTSRVALKLRAERLITLEPLATGSIDAAGPAGRQIRPAGGSAVSVPPAVELFTERALQVNAGFRLDGASLPQVAELARRLDGVPLALELAAAWTSVISPAELLTELSAQLELTARMSDLPERQRSVRASCDWSWNLLTAEQQAGLMRCSIFRGGFFAEAAAAVIGSGGMALRGLLAGLSEKNWLYVRDFDGQARYALRDAAAREYAWERLCATGCAGDSGTLHAQAAAAHAQYFIQLAEREGPRLRGAGQPDRGQGQLAALRTWKHELQNVHQALQHRLGDGDPATLVECLRWFGYYLYSTAAFRAEYELLSMVQAAVQGRELRELELALRTGLGRALHCMGRNTEGAAEAQAGLALATELDAGWAIFNNLIILASVALDRGDTSDSQAYSQQALALLDAPAGRSLLGASRILNNLGAQAVNAGDYPTARGYLTRSLASAQADGDLFGEAFAVMNLGVLDAELGDYRSARSRFQEALENARLWGDRQREAEALENLGFACLQLGEVTAALQLWRQSVVFLRELGNSDHILLSSWISAPLLARLERWEAAATIIATTTGREALAQRLSRLDSAALDAARRQIVQAGAAGAFTSQQLAQWQAAGSVLSADEVARFTVAVLDDAIALDTAGALGAAGA